MELIDFLRQTQTEVRSEIGDRLGSNGDAYPYPEMVFAEVVMQHMSQIGMTFDPQVCHYSAKVGNANLRLSGFAMSEDTDQLDLFVSLYAGVDELYPLATPRRRPLPNSAFAFWRSASKDDSHQLWMSLMTLTS